MPALKIYDGSAWRSVGTLSGTSVFSDYTPTNTNVTVGNGTQVARYTQNGKLVTLRYALTWGSTTAFSGGVEIGLPVAAATTGTQAGLSTVVYLLDSGTAEYPALFATRGVVGSSTKVAVLRGTDGVALTGTVPFTWATNDVLSFTLTYEAA